LSLFRTIIFTWCGYDNEHINTLHTNAKLFNLLNAELNPTRHLLALVGARHFVHVSRVRVNVESDGKCRKTDFYLFRPAMSAVVLGTAGGNVGDINTRMT
jgi:hypothetical protein